MNRPWIIPALLALCVLPAAAQAPCGPAQAEATREFRENLLPVLRDPRCANCHGAMNLFSETTAHPGGSFAGKEEALNETGWVACAECHDAAPKDPKAPEELQWRAVLGKAARWGQASEKDLCAALKASVMNPAQFVDHMQNDVRVTLGFAGKRGQNGVSAEPPSRTQAQFVEATRRWVDAMGGAQGWGNPACGCEGLADKTAGEGASAAGSLSGSVVVTQDTMEGSAAAGIANRYTATSGEREGWVTWEKKKVKVHFDYEGVPASLAPDQTFTITVKGKVEETPKGAGDGWTYAGVVASTGLDLVSGKQAERGSDGKYVFHVPKNATRVTIDLGGYPMGTAAAWRYESRPP